MDVYHTSTHGVALVWVADAGLKCAVCGSVEIQDAKMMQKIAISAPSHRFVFAQLGIYRQSEKDLLSSNTSSTCTCYMVNFGPLTPEISSGVRGTPANFKGFCILPALLHGTLVVGVSQILQHWTERHLYSAGPPSRGTLAHILVITQDIAHIGQCVNAVDVCVAIAVAFTVCAWTELFSEKM